MKKTNLTTWSNRILQQNQQEMEQNEAWVCKYAPYTSLKTTNNLLLTTYKLYDEAKVNDPKTIAAYNKQPIKALKTPKDITCNKTFLNLLPNLTYQAKDVQWSTQQLALFELIIVLSECENYVKNISATDLQWLLSCLCHTLNPYALNLMKASMLENYQCEFFFVKEKQIRSITLDLSKSQAWKTVINEHVLKNVACFENIVRNVYQTKTISIASEHVVMTYIDDVLSFIKHQTITIPKSLYWYYHHEQKNTRG